MQPYPTFYLSFFRPSKADKSVISGGIWQIFKLILAFMHFLTTCEYEKDLMKNSGENVMMFVFPTELWEMPGIEHIFTPKFGFVRQQFTALDS